MLITQTRKVELLEKQLAEANRKLDDKILTIENAGSLAEAAMRLNGVFEAAQKAADQYLENIRHMQQPAIPEEEAEHGRTETAN